LSYEHDLEFVPYLPILFVNSVVLFNSTQTKPIHEATLLLDNLFQSLAIRHCKNKNDLEKAIQFKDKYFSKQFKYSREIEFVTEWVRHLSAHNSNLANDIGSIALSWGVQSTDRKISLESYHIFAYLNRDYNYNLLEKLTLCLFEAVRVRNDDKIFIIMDIFSRVPEDVMTPPKSLKLLFQLAFWLFLSWNKKHFIIGLNYIHQLQNLATKGVSEKSVLDSCMFNVWKGHTDEPVDVAVAKVIFKGLSDSETFEQTFSLYQNLVHSFKSFLEKNNMLIAANLLLHFVLLASGDHSKKDLIATFLQNECGM
jgi:hypothetical protein